MPTGKKFVIALMLIFLSCLFMGCGEKETEPPVAPGGSALKAQVEKPEEIEAPPEIKKNTEKLDGTYLVMVENSPSARPQAGLNSADTVYEMLVEGGISRFMAVYSTFEVDKIGPIRSTRVDFVELASAYGGPYIYAGGHQVALNMAPKLNIQSLNQIEGRMTPYFWRSKDRIMPHNLYSNGELIKKGIEDYSYTLGRLDSMPHGQMSGGNPATEITIRYYETVSYKYKDGTYHRYGSGEPHYLENREVIAPANLLVLLASHQPYAPGDERLKINITGKGNAYFFSRGMVYETKWERPTAGDLFSFTTTNNEDLLFSPGQVWINIVPKEDSRVSYK